MKSSFKRKDGGGKDTLNHYYFGCPDLDAIFNNELNKSTLFLIEEDSPTRHHLSLTRYFAACGVHMNQKVIIYDCFLKRWENIIPPVQSTKPAAEALKKEQSDSTAEKSKIAWRYDSQDIKLKDTNYPKNLPIVDLSKTLDKEFKEEMNKQQLLQLINVNNFSSLKELFANICQTVQDSLKDSNDKTTKRIIFPSFNNPFMSIQYQEQEFVKFLISIKTLIRSSHCALLMTIPTDLSKYLRNNLRFYFDFVVGLEPKIASKEFEDFQGFFRIIKTPSTTSFLSYDIETDVYGFKASKKKFEVEKLYINPEPDVTFDDVNKPGQVKKEGPLLCTSKPGGTDKSLEF